MNNQILKADLIAKIEAAWTTMNNTLEALSEDQLTKPDPKTGWSVKDHLAHLAAWEQGVVALLNGQPRWAAMGVDQATVEATDMDGLNDILVEQSKQRSLDEVLAAFRAAHQGMMAALEKMDQADLYRNYTHFDPSGKEEPIIQWIISDSYDHYEEHQGWIEKMIQ